MFTAITPQIFNPRPLAYPLLRKQGLGMEVPYNTPTDSTQLWLRDKRAVQRFSISRTKLFKLAKEGRIRSVSLREPGTSRGTRLFCVKSIEAYIESFLPENQKTQQERA